LSLFGCIVEDGDKACSKNQVRVDGEGLLFCECAPGYIIDTTNNVDCIPCGENEQAVKGKCECSEGFTRPSEGAACQMSALGAACSDNAGCSGDFPVCVVGSGGGYCTESCTASTDCERGWVCDTAASGKACKKPPTGYGMSCMTAADCAGNDASFCESFQSKSCQVECSKTKPCPGDWGCCDFTVMVICLEPSALMGGMCPSGGKLVTP
jgi:hypothetical protein